VTVILALTTGLVVGLIFALLRLPIPAPQVFEGIAGIVGLWLGYMLVVHFSGLLAVAQHFFRTGV
jgi:XapX domain-containing protein